MSEVIVRAFHFVFIMVMFSTLFAQHMLVSKEMTKAQFRKVSIIDRVYGVSAMLMLVVGFLLWFSVGNTSEYYSANWVFHIKLTLFGIVAILSIIPTVFFIKNKNQEGPMIEVPGYLIGIIRAELFLLLCIPFVATAMAKGFGLG